MSELYQVTVENVAGARIELAVTTVHPDAGPPPEASSFPLNLLVDLWDLFERGFTALIQGIPPMEDAESKALALRAPWGPLFGELRDLSRGAQVPISEAEYQAINDGPDKTWKGQPLSGWGISEGHHFVHLRGDEPAFVVAAARIIKSYAQERLANQDAYQDWPDDAELADLPRALLVVELHHPALLGFVKPGMSFDTAAYF
jgi:hypothetical protein